MPGISFVALGAILMLRPMAPAQESNADRVNQLIRQLDSSTFAERESAFEELLQIGESAIGKLQAAAKQGSVETRFRALKIIRVSSRRILENGFRTLDASQTDEAFDVEQAMWLIARIVDPQVRKSHLTQQLDGLAEMVRTHLGKNVDVKKLAPDEAVDAICTVLFEKSGFRGNVKDYDNPNNSSLDVVLRTKQGLPIVLSQVVISVGRRLGVPIVGIGTSGRYFCKYDGEQAPGGPKQDIFIDPFGGGRVLTIAGLKDEFPAFGESDLVPYSNRETVARMMRNLSADFAHQGDFDSVGRVDALNSLIKR